MKEAASIRLLLKKYDLTRPVSPVDQKKILTAKRKGLSDILKQKKQGGVAMGFSLRLYSMMKDAGMNVSPAAGLRAAAAVFAAAVISATAVSGLLIERYFYQDVIPPSGVVVAHAGDVKIIRDGLTVQAEQKAALKQGDEILTGKDSGILFQYRNGIVLRILSESRVEVLDAGKNMRYHVSEGGFLSRIPAGSDLQLYEVSTPDGAVIAAGTEFGVFYYDDETLVFVSEGEVAVTHGASGITYNISGGYASVVNEKAEVGRMNPNEESLMKAFAEYEFIEDIDSLSIEEMKKINEQFTGHEYRSVKEVERLFTIDELKEKYGRIDTITLYSGRRIKGVIISRGDSYTILTPGGRIYVQLSQIRDTQTIR